MVSVLKSGFYTSVQDLGRHGYQDQGVPVSGVMDVYSAKLANALLNNEDTTAVLELTMVGPVLQFHCNTLIAITGADLSPVLNNKPLKLNSVIAIKKDDVLTFSASKYGFRSYLAVRNGFETALVLGSRSMFKGVTANEKLVKGSTLPICEVIHSNEITKMASVKVNYEHFSSTGLSVSKGPEYDLLSKDLKEKLKGLQFVISNENNRMAYKLDTEILKNNLKPIITSAVLPGTVQLTPSGQLIILMRDCQTTGGYPRILQLTEYAIAQLSQKFNGDTILFNL